MLTGLADSTPGTCFSTLSSIKRRGVGGKFAKLLASAKASFCFLGQISSWEIQTLLAVLHQHPSNVQAEILVLLSLD